MTTDCPIFAAVYHHWLVVKSRPYVQIVLEVPVELSDAAYQVLGGMPKHGSDQVWVGVTRLNKELFDAGHIDVKATEIKTEKPKAIEAPPKDPPNQEKPKPRLTMSQRAALVCKEALFHRFVERKIGPGSASVTEENATDYLRFYCGVDSRSKIKVDTEAGILFEQLMTEFAAWRLAA